MSRRLPFAVLLLLACGVRLAVVPAAAAPAFEPAAAIRDAAARFVREQMPQALRAGARVDVQGPAPALHFPRCTQLAARAFGAASPFGAQTVEVSCAAPQRWSLYLPVRVDTLQGAVLALHALGAGHVIAPADLTVVPRDLSSLPAGALSDPRQAVGQVLSYGVAAGQVLSRDMLRGPRLIRYGQSVSLIASAPGMRLSALGVALQDGSQGQDIMVRNAQSGRVVHGVVGADGDVLVQVGGAAQLAASNP
jgi:flagella basal body P-ring formation protein FlgA